MVLELKGLSAFTQKLRDAGVTSILEIYVKQLGSAWNTDSEIQNF